MNRSQKVEKKMTRRPFQNNFFFSNLDESVPQATDSPIIDVERISSDEEVDGNKGIWLNCGCIVSSFLISIQRNAIPSTNIYIAIDGSSPLKLKVFNICI